jgi:hypothetical protein
MCRGGLGLLAVVEFLLSVESGDGELRLSAAKGSLLACLADLGVVAGPEITLLAVAPFVSLTLSIAFGPLPTLGSFAGEVARAARGMGMMPSKQAAQAECDIHGQCTGLAIRNLN